MDAIADAERRARLLKLEDRVLNPRDILNTDCLLVIIFLQYFIFFLLYCVI